MKLNFIQELQKILHIVEECVISSNKFEGKKRWKVNKGTSNFNLKSKFNQEIWALNQFFQQFLSLT